MSCRQCTTVLRAVRAVSGVVVSSIQTGIACGGGGRALAMWVHRPGAPIYMSPLCNGGLGTT